LAAYITQAHQHPQSSVSSGLSNTQPARVGSSLSCCQTGRCALMWIDGKLLVASRAESQGWGGGGAAAAAANG